MIAFCGALLAFAVTCRGAATVRSPCESRAGGLSCTLRVEVATVRLPFKNISFQARTYNGMLPGPPIRASPGDHVSILVQNRLGDDDVNGLGCTSKFGQFRAANSTNLHIHGIHADEFQDNTFECIGPGKDLLYEYQIGADTGTSTLWYHPHVTGSSAMQLYGGMAGAFEIVDAAQDSNLAFADTRVLVLQMLDFNPKSKDYIETFMSMKGVNTLPLQLHNPEKYAGRLLLTNGEVAPSMALQQGRQARLKLINAMSGSQNILNVGFIGAAAATCQLHVLAYDGVYISAPRRQRSVLVPPGGRADVAVMCRGAGKHVLGTLLAGAEAYGGLFGGEGFTVLAVDVQSRAEPHVADGLPSALPGPPPFYADLSKARPEGYHTIMLGNVAGQQVVNGRPFDGTVSHTARPGSIQEWSLIGGEGHSLQKSHPYHQHVVHFQVMTSSLAQHPLIAVEGDYRDTLPLYRDLNYTVRFKNPFFGRMMVHCHITKHSDLGMMTIVDFADQPTSSLSHLPPFFRAHPYVVLAALACLFVASAAFFIASVKWRRAFRCRCHGNYLRF